MSDNHKLFLENIDKNGLLPSNKKPVQFGSMVGMPVQNKEQGSNIFSMTNTPPTPAFGNLTTMPDKLAGIQSAIKKTNTNAIDGLDTDILSNSKFKQIEDKNLKLKLKIARLQAELEEHKKTVEASFLKADKSHYQKLTEIQHRMETELQRLVAEYQHRQLKSIVFSPFVKLFHFLQSYVTLR